MSMRVGTALFGLVLLASAPAAFGAQTEERVNAKYLDVLQNLRNISQPQLEYLRHIALQSAEEIAHGFVARFREALTLNETERESLAAAAKAAGEELPVSGRRSFRAGDDGSDDCEGEGDGAGAGDGDGDGDGCEAKESIQDTIRRILREGLPSQGIPPLDPLTVAELPQIDLDLVDVLELHATLSDVSFDGLSGFQEDVDVEYRIQIFPPSVTFVVGFDVLFPRLHLLTQYVASGHAEAGLDIHGEGPINIDIFRLRVKGDISVRGTLTSMTVQPCDINLTSRSMNLKIEGLFGGGLISDLAGEIVTEMINEYVWDLIFETASPIIENGVCTQLRSMTVSDWIRILQKIGIL